MEPCAGNDIASLIEALDKIPDPDGFLSTLVDELTSLLKQTLDLWTLVKRADANVDPGLGDRPSIKPHPQNHGFASWSWLIELVWRAWKRIDEMQPMHSRRLIERWCSLDYPTFRRLALQAIGESLHWTEEEKVEMLLSASDENPLWSSSFHKEAFDLLVSIWPRLNASARERLIARVIDGPPSGHGKDEDVAEWQIFERLAVLHRLGHQLMPSPGAAKLGEIKIRHEAWEIQDGERAHFLSWTESGLGYPTKYTIDELLDLAPDGLVSTVVGERIDRHGLLEVWSAASQTRPKRAVALLLRLASQGYGPADLWRATLFGLREAVQRPEVARRVLAALAGMPDAVLGEAEMVSSVSACLRNLSQASALEGDSALWRLWQRLRAECRVAGRDCRKRKLGQRGAEPTCRKASRSSSGLHFQAPAQG